MAKRTCSKSKKVNVQRYVFVLALTIIVFVSGMLLGNRIASNKIAVIEDMGQDIRTDIIALEIQEALVEDNPCEASDFNPLSEQLYQLGQRLDFMENRLGKDNKDVISLKEYYSLLEIRHWLLMKKVNQQCENSSILILYFYSNKDDCPQCEEQGYVLSYLHDKYPGLMIYSFDINMQNPALKTVKELFSLSHAPSVIVNEEVFEGFQSRKALENAMQELKE